MKPFWLSVQFLSRFPTPSYQAVSEKEMGAMLHWFPVVGLLIGACLWLAAQLMLWLPVELVSALILAAWIWVTGGLHLDGLADSADGWLGSNGDAERALQIMKDSAIGSGGGIAIAMMLLLKWATLTEILENGQTIWLLAVPLLARIAVLGLMDFTPYVSPKGVASGMLEYRNRFLISTWLVLVLLTLSWQAWSVALGLVLITLWNRWWMMRLTGGLSGDTAGASIEIAEWAVLVAILTLA